MTNHSPYLLQLLPPRQASHLVPLILKGDKLTVVIICSDPSFATSSHQCDGSTIISLYIQKEFQEDLPSCLATCA